MNSWKIPARMRELEEGKAPREVTFCLDEAEQAEYRARWLLGEEISDIRRDLADRKGSKQQSHASWEPAGDAPETVSDTETPTPDRWASKAFDGSRPRFD